MPLSHSVPLPHSLMRSQPAPAPSYATGPLSHAQRVPVDFSSSRPPAQPRRKSAGPLPAALNESTRSLLEYALQPKKGWDDSIHDLTRNQLPPQQMIEKHLRMLSKRQLLKIAGIKEKTRKIKKNRNNADNEEKLGHAFTIGFQDNPVKSLVANRKIQPKKTEEIRENQEEEENSEEEKSIDSSRDYSGDEESFLRSSFSSSSGRLAAAPRLTAAPPAFSPLIKADHILSPVQEQQLEDETDSEDEEDEEINRKSRKLHASQSPLRAPESAGDVEPLEQQLAAAHLAASRVQSASPATRRSQHFLSEVRASIDRLGPTDVAIAPILRQISDFLQEFSQRSVTEAEFRRTVLDSLHSTARQVARQAQEFEVLQEENAALRRALGDFKKEQEEKWNFIMRREKIMENQPPQATRAPEGLSDAENPRISRVNPFQQIPQLVQSNNPQAAVSVNSSFNAYNPDRYGQNRQDFHHQQPSSFPFSSASDSIKPNRSFVSSSHSPAKQAERQFSTAGPNTFQPASAAFSSSRLSQPQTFDSDVSYVDLDVEEAEERQKFEAAKSAIAGGKISLPNSANSSPAKMSFVNVPSGDSDDDDYLVQRSGPAPQPLRPQTVAVPIVTVASSLVGGPANPSTGASRARTPASNVSAVSSQARRIVTNNQQQQKPGQSAWAPAATFRG